MRRENMVSPASRSLEERQEEWSSAWTRGAGTFYECRAPVSYDEWVRTLQAGSARVNDNECTATMRLMQLVLFKGTSATVIIPALRLDDKPSRLPVNRYSGKLHKDYTVYEDIKSILPIYIHIYPVRPCRDDLCDYT